MKGAEATLLMRCGACTYLCLHPCRFLGHFGPVTGIDLHSSKGAMDFSDLLLTSSADWTIKAYLLL